MERWAPPSTAGVRPSRGLPPTDSPADEPPHLVVQHSQAVDAAPGRGGRAAASRDEVVLRQLRRFYRSNAPTRFTSQRDADAQLRKIARLYHGKEDLLWSRCDPLFRTSRSRCPGIASASLCLSAPSTPTHPSSALRPRSRSFSARPLALPARAKRRTAL